MLTNKKEKESIHPTPKPNIESQTMNINKNNMTNNLNNLIQKKSDNLNRTGSDIYISNNSGKKDEEKINEEKKNEEKEKNFFNQGGFKLIPHGLKEGLIYESDNPFQKNDDIFKENGKESIIENEDDIPEYDYLNQKIINANL